MNAVVNVEEEPPVHRRQTDREPDPVAVDVLDQIRFPSPRADAHGAQEYADLTERSRG